MMNKKSESIQKQRIQVFARCRPLNTFEKKQCSPSIVDVIPDKKEIIVKDRNVNREFFFDKVFPSDTKQIAVYKAVVGPLIREVLMGYNCTVFAYGQTGTGKTYTMEGERSNTTCSWEDDPGAGIIPRSLHQLFEELNKEDNVEFSVRVSFLELYNEELFDLLSSAELSRLRLFEDSSRKGSVIIQGLEEIIVNSKDEVYAILERGTARRQTAATMLNATSSRSHTVFSVTVHIKENTIDGEELLKTGKLNLVDLAGSENVGRSGAVDKRAREAGNINQSLLTLGRVITALIEKQPHVPYRESKLTRLLQDSLGGHTKTSIIATISPALCNSDETLSTLDYATKAKSITIKPEANQRMEKKTLIREYTEEIEKLRRDLLALRNKEGFYVDTDNYMSLLNEVTEKKDCIKYLQDKFECLKEDKRKIDDLFGSTSEKLEKINDELDLTNKKCKETEQELLNTTRALNYTQKVLAEITLDRDEKQYLIGVHSKTESKLLQQAQSLLQVADQSTYHVDKLHEKIERKQNVEKSNEEQCQDFRITYQEQFAKLQDMVTDAKKELISNLDGINTNLGCFVQHLKNVQQQSINHLNHIVNDCKKQLTDFSSCLITKADEQKLRTESLLQDISIKENMLSAEQSKFLSDSIPSYLHQLKIIHSNMDNWVIAVHATVCEKIEYQKEILRKQAVEKSSLINTIQNSLKSFHESHENILIELKQQIESNDECEMAKEKIVEEFVKKFAEVEKKEREVSLQTKGKWIEAKNNLTCFKAFDEPLITLSKQNEYQAQAYEAMLDDTSSAIKIDEYCDNAKLHHEEQRNMVMAVEKFFGDHERNKKDNFIKLETELQSNSLSVTENLQSVENIIEEVNSSMEKKLNNANLSFEHDSRKIHDYVSATDSAVSTAKEGLETNMKQIKEETLKGTVKFERFFEDLKKDIPTGTTPQRTVYTYPKVFATTSPHVRLLQSYRSKLAADTAIAVNLPLDSSFDEQEEQKISPPFIDSTSGVIDLTSPSDDSEDTNSCASSMSDLSSIDSNTNKENKPKTKTSRLPKRIKTPKVFIKPAPPMDRKPLSLTNSDLEN